MLIIRVVAFDEPGTLYTQSLSFEDRYTNLIFSLSPIHPFIVSSHYNDYYYYHHFYYYYNEGNDEVVDICSQDTMQG